jgi:hypothetical protein
VDCPECEGANEDCKACKGEGHREITRCPKSYLTPEILDFFHYADLQADGLPPVAGGALSQTAGFLQSLQYMRREENRWRAAKMNKP